ncbi:MAG: B12-binding domain-containing radical SAM protein [Deltaproteobacteria bacterium]|nr:B12-binding domain-containing radical SAM protein [Deltaproteobacteria bacterium]
MEFGFVHLGRENLGIEYLSSVLKRAGHRTRLHYDPGLFGPNDNVFYVPRLEKRFTRFHKIVGDILRRPPDVLAFSVYTNTYQWALSILAAAREGGFAGKVIFGGYHATLVPDQVMADSRADAVCFGETEAIIVDLAEALAGHKPMAEVRNVLWRDGERVVRNPMADAIADLDTIPFPDKALFETEINYEDDYLIMTGRGCPLSCSFCCEATNNAIYKNKYFRRRDPRAVIDELLVMGARYGFREVMVNDAMIFTNAKWLGEFLRLYREQIRLPFRAFAYPKFMTREIAEELVGSGCYAIEFGLQSTNEQIRKEVLNRHETNDQAMRAFKICDEVGLPYDIDHIFGIPGEQEKDFFEAAAMYAKLRRLNRIKCHLLSFFPNTPIVEKAHRDGLISDERLAQINRGEIGDFFHSATVTEKQALRRIDDFSRLYKFLPILPEPVVHKVLNTGINRQIGRLPSPVIIALQVLGAIKGRDYRFWLYIKYYLRRLTRHFVIQRMTGADYTAPSPAMQHGR